MLLLAAPLFASSDLAPFDASRGNDLVDLQRLQGLARAGDARAAFLLGATLASGRAGGRDDSEAQRWFRQAASAGLPVAQYNLAVMLAAGRGSERNFAEALRWYEAAGEQGMAEAQFNAGMLLLQGAPGVPRDSARGIVWLRKAAGRGLAPAEYNLGVLREFGRGMERDLNAALAWYERASRQNYEPARARLARLKSAAAAAGAALPDDTGAGTPPPTPATGRVSAANRWVLARNPAHFTLQLFSGRDEKAARDFIATHAIDDRGGYYRSVNAAGERRFAVVYGDFASETAAAEAARRLPGEFGVAKPWVRTFGAIQKVIER